MSPVATCACGAFSATSTDSPLAHVVASPSATCTGGAFSSIHWRKYCTCTRATFTVWWWSVVVVYIYIYIYTSIEAYFQRASLLRHSGATALQQRWLGDGASSNASSISLFAPVVDPVAKRWCSRQESGHDSGPMMAIPCQCSSGRMKPSYGKANPKKPIVPL